MGVQKKNTKPTTLIFFMIFDDFDFYDFHYFYLPRGP